MNDSDNGRAALAADAADAHAHPRSGDAALDALYAGRADLRRLARDLGLSLAQLADWAGQPDGAAAIASLRQLADHRAALAISRARTDAAKALLRLARDRDAKETARKACVDLLRLAPDEPASPARTTPAPNTAPDDPLTPQEAEAWRAALEHLGRPDEPRSA